jgi:predicted component of type VI protein secretion system
MRTRLLAVALLLAAVTACSSGGDAEPVKTVTATASPSPDKAQVTADCVDAVAERAKESEGEVPFDPTPAPCAPLSDSEYLDAYYDGLAQANKDALGG